MLRTIKDNSNLRRLASMGSPERVHQLSLFDVGRKSPSSFVGVEANAQAIAEMSRRDDAETSRLAAARMVKSGKLRENQAKVLAALYKEPASTYAEIAEIASLSQPEPARRVPELRALGLVMSLACESRECTIRKTKCSVWRLTGKGMDWMEDGP